MQEAAALAEHFLQLLLQPFIVLSVENNETQTHSLLLCRLAGHIIFICTITMIKHTFIYSIKLTFIYKTYVHIMCCIKLNLTMPSLPGLNVHVDTSISLFGKQVFINVFLFKTSFSRVSLLYAFAIFYHVELCMTM